jgi:diguanylate cyclase
MADPRGFAASIQWATDPERVSLALRHEGWLVGASFAAALLCTYAALELADRGRRSARPMLWTAIAGAVFATAIWCAHFIGLLAIVSPRHALPDTGDSLASLLFMVISGSLAYVIAGRRLHLLRYGAAAALTAGAGLAMHYWDVLVMDIDAEISLRATWLILSGLGAFVGAFICIAITHRVVAPERRVIAAFPIAATVTVLHFADMAAMALAPNPSFEPMHAASSKPLVAAAIVGGAFLLAAASAWFNHRDRHTPARAQNEAADADPDQGVVIIPTPTPSAQRRRRPR